MFDGRSWARVGLFLASLWLAPMASAQLVDPACDANGDGIVDDLPEDYEEPQQYGNLLNFYAITMGSSPLHAPAPLGPFKLNASVDVGYVPQLTCGEQAVYGGYKTERTNKTYAIPRVRLLLGLPMGFYAGLSGLPPVPAFGVTSSMVSAEVGYGHSFLNRLQVGVRAYGLAGRVVGDLAGPLDYQTAVDDSFKDKLLSAEGMAGYALSVGKASLTPYLGIGYTRVFATMHVGEDDVDVPGTNPDMLGLQYSGPSGEVGAQLKTGDLDIALEGYAVPTNIDPGNPRFFFSPRIRVGWDFF